MSNARYPSHKNLFILLLLLLYSSCTVINVYVPGYQVSKTGRDSFVENNFFEIQSKQSKENFAQIDPFLFGMFYSKEYPNLKGDIKQLLSYEFVRNEQNYNLLAKKGKKLLVIVNDFQLKSTDHCSKNISTVKLNIQTFTTDEKKPILNFSFEDNIDSLTGDCYTLASSVPLFLGWIWYMPYLGFRGDREDQLNALGRLALLKYFARLDAVINRKGETNE
ncbi:MAG: hypothetical protein AAF518_15235 [Spirochaetota bacterium]